MAVHVSKSFDYFTSRWYHRRSHVAHPNSSCNSSDSLASKGCCVVDYHRSTLLLFYNVVFVLQSLSNYSYSPAASSGKRNATEFWLNGHRLGKIQEICGHHMAHLTAIYFLVSATCFKFYH